MEIENKTGMGINWFLTELEAEMRIEDGSQWLDLRNPHQGSMELWKLEIPRYVNGIDDRLAYRGYNA